MKNISVMIKPASSLCNMKCRYCFYADEAALRSTPCFGKMSKETADAVLNNVFADMDKGDVLSIAFQGGEPTLSGLDFFTYFADRARGLAGERGAALSWSIQTNGMLIDESWCSFFKKNGFLAGLSLDGPADIHDANRIDAAGKGSFKRVLETKRLFDKTGVEYNVLMTLTNGMARHPKQVWDFIIRENIRFVQFVPCLGPLEGTSIRELTPGRYGSFYSELFRYWYTEFISGNYISVKLFDDMINLLGKGQCNACGLLGNCTAQLIVEADGSTYPCDFFAVDRYRTGSLARQSLREVWESAAALRFTQDLQDRPKECEGCSYNVICNGGCKRMRANVTSLSGGACGHRIFLDSAMPYIVKISGNHP